MISKRKAHWEKVYRSKESHEVSWSQDVPVTSLRLIQELNPSKTARIIDVGGGDSRLVDHLLDEGYDNITVLDISSKALEKAKERLGTRATQVQWLVGDILDFYPESQFDLWHDRATFHFLTDSREIIQYIDLARRAVNKFLIMATFSESGPEKCSGLNVKQYSEQLLEDALSNGFSKIRCVNEDHITPFNTNQNFLFCSFNRLL